MSTTQDASPPISVTTFIVADHAEAVNGKLYVTGGGWDTVSVGGFPAVHPHLSIGVVLHVPWNRTNERHTFEVDLRNEDGLTMLPQPVAGEFETGRPPAMRPGDETTVVLSLNFNGLPFQAEGQFSWVFVLDDEPIARVPLRVRMAEQPAGQ